MDVTKAAHAQTSAQTFTGVKGLNYCKHIMGPVLTGATVVH